MGRQNTSILALTVMAIGVVAAHRFVGHDGNVAAAAGNALGVACSDAVANDAMPVDVIGTTVVEAGAAIAAGAAVQVDATGRAVTKTAGVTVARLAPGESAAAAGEFVEVLLIAN